MPCSILLALLIDPVAPGAGLRKVLRLRASLAAPVQAAALYGQVGQGSWGGVVVVAVVVVVVVVMVAVVEVVNRIITLFIYYLNPHLLPSPSLPPSLPSGPGRAKMSLRARGDGLLPPFTLFEASAAGVPASAFSPPTPSAG
jgi:hypothetical protein